MSGAVCPGCGVAVVPGYVRCPKCHKSLPRRASTVAEGGTALETSRPIGLVVAIGAGVVVLGVIAFLASRGPAAQPVPLDAAPTIEIDVDDESGTVRTLPSPDLSTPTSAAAASPGAAAAALEQALKRERLWSTVTVSGSRVDVRSSSCGDPEMATILDGAAASLGAEGATQLRCLEQSGRVVSDRGL